MYPRNPSERGSVTYLPGHAITCKLFFSPSLSPPPNTICDMTRPRDWPGSRLRIYIGLPPDFVFAIAGTLGWCQLEEGWGGIYNFSDRRRNNSTLRFPQNLSRTTHRKKTGDRARARRCGKDWILCICVCVFRLSIYRDRTTHMFGFRVAGLWRDTVGGGFAPVQ
jgi:hypothetical protein